MPASPSFWACVRSLQCRVGGHRCWYPSCTRSDPDVLAQLGVWIATFTDYLDERVKAVLGLEGHPFMFTPRCYGLNAVSAGYSPSPEQHRGKSTFFRGQGTSAPRPPSRSWPTPRCSIFHSLR